MKFIRYHKLAIKLEQARILDGSCYITLYNRFGFPAPEVLKRCALRKIPVYRTDLNGAVHAVSDGQKWAVSSEGLN